MLKRQKELRAAADTLLTSLDRLAALEAEKRQLTPDDPRLTELADEVEGLAAEIFKIAKVQGHLVETAHMMAMTDDAADPSRPSVDVDRSLYDILDEWRTAERALAEAPPGSAESMEALARARELRADYQRAYQDVQHRER